MLRPDRFGVRDLVIWIARYGAEPDAAAGHYDVHQYSDAGRIPGIHASGVDLNESYTNAHLTGGAAPTRKAATELMERRTIPASPSSASVRSNVDFEIDIVG
ncbi:hypothetical protein NQK81_33410 [Amycolatopsis roodepoortensis]|uniref:hypothetical protein n=1 Tax=Amycolatopsis roodepoortensis TaxID=700274 RepID=UPI00214B09DA|nr:hypothetical protein [Amycolatopsis roodepoortensis]UUV29631.1 hypothetical protein NQK81_33410 [Amycolatopsis roodepoortensis]